ncbi:HAT family dimerization domain-containing protein [Aphelenchoides avenae]|nr:HAT family dimerization domain-containing protein [Aphelenchus avenae]
MSSGAGEKRRDQGKVSRFRKIADFKRSIQRHVERERTSDGIADHKETASSEGRGLDDATGSRREAPTEALARIERTGRALRKSAAIEDDGDHFTGLAPPSSSASSRTPSRDEVRHHGAASAPVLSDFSAKLAAVAAAASQGLVVPHPQPVSTTPDLHSVPVTVDPSSFAALIQPTAIKHEQLSREDLLSLVTSNQECLQWMSSIGAPVGVNALANLSAFMQPERNLIGAEEISTSEDKKSYYDVSKMDSRNHSTESTASTSSAGVNLGSEGIPRKQDIQTDIRLNKGRFQLVRKRGRSEVWNLFGQVVDTLTGNRLPYVACYACKVLYTDTGGGTGNMTRHRCSMGNSYRSYAGSSTETATESINAQSSFESLSGTLNVNGPPSPEPFAQESQHCPTTAREIFAQSSGSYYHGSGSFSSGIGSTHASTSTESAASLGRSASCSAAPQSTPTSHAPATTSSATPQQPAQPAPSINVPPVTGHGYVFTAADKQLFAQAVVQFCAQDLHNYDVVEGEGFKNLVETVLFLGRRSHGDPSGTAFDPVRNLIPDSKQLREVVSAQDRSVRRSTMQDLSCAMDYGISISCQGITFADEQYISVVATYITEDWQITRRTLKVKQGTSAIAVDLLREVFREWGLEEAKSILLTLDTELDEVDVESLPPNVTIIRNVHRAINIILAECFDDCSEMVHILPLIHLCYRAVKALKDLGALSESLPQSFIDAALNFQSSGSTKGLDFADSVYETVKFVKDNVRHIRVYLDKGKCVELLNEVNDTDWSVANVLDIFLEPFHETNQMFTDSKQPHFQRILPEWYALIHECQLSTESKAEGSERPEPKEARPLDEPSQKKTTGDLSRWLSALRQSAERHLRKWISENIRFEHKIATVLYPRLKQLPVICSDMERLAVYSRIREIVGLKREKCNKPASDANGEAEPSRKRRHFLSQLEDCAAEDDELEAYLRTPFPHHQTKNILEFWSSIGEKHFPHLAKLARFILATSGACAPLTLSEPSSRLSATDIRTWLMLRPEVMNSMNRSHSGQRHLPKV